MDGAEFRTIGHQVIDTLADYFDGIEGQPVFPAIDPETLESLFDEPPPADPSSAQELISALDEHLLPYCVHTGHGGYMGLITGSPLPIGVIGDLIASAINQNLGAYSIGPAAVAMERRTVRWLCDLVGFGDGAGGNLTSGGMIANLIGMKLGRDHASAQTAQHAGVTGPLAVYTSEERHVSVDKAADVIGLGRASVRPIRTDAAFRIRIAELEHAIQGDLESGVRPACIVAMAGSTNTGAVDDLRELRRIADRHGIWLHVDAAYGGGLLASKKWSHLLEGVEEADSVTIDPHKWFYAPVDAGAVLVRDERGLESSFGLRPSYLTDEFDTAGARYQYYVHGLEQSRRFRALKVWMSFKRYGVDQLGKWVDRNVGHARRMHELAVANPRFESAVSPPMSAACVRYVPEGVLLRDQVDALHFEAVRRIERSGEFWIGTTRLKGQTWFRACTVNFRTTGKHIDRLMELLEQECRAIEREEGTHV